MKLGIGDRVEARILEDISGERVRVPDEARLVHLQFRRFAGCPMCNLHLRAVAIRHDEIVAAGIREIVVLPSTVQSMREYQADLPFAAIADPQRRLYRQFGVRSSIRALASLRAWGALLRGVRSVPHGGPRDGEGGLGLPADFLIDTSGHIVARHYGMHGYDQWSVDDLLALAGAPAGARPGERSKMNTRARNVAYWVTTIVVATAFVVPGIMHLVRAPHIALDMAHLGYPAYMLTILGVWKVLGALTIVVPGFPRLKEWAYAGMIFDLTGAAVSRAAAGDGIAMVVVPLAVAAMVVCSNVLRPTSRALVPATEPRATYREQPA
jgi:uncharacterized membrane protein YphA (DoxX/SURF4 family)/peroxiredoxin